jgi:3-oxoadipate enol-lactonase
MDALARDFRVLRFDTRGHGQSTVTPGPYAIEGLGRDVLALADHLGIERFDFCGLSMGGMTGMWLGIHAPLRVRRLVLANTAAQIPPPELWNARIEKVATSGMASISEAVLARWFTTGFLARETTAVAAMKRMIEATPAAGYIACCAAVRDMDLRADVARIIAPTLVLAGTQDLATPPADGAYLAAQIAGARMLELEAGHLSNIEQAPAFTAALLAHLTA